MTTTITLDQVRDLANQLTIRDRAQLVTELTPQIAAALDREQEAVAPPCGSPQAILEAMRQAGGWEGDDREKLLELVSATRSQITAE
jgi:hypothetical protein